MTTSTRRVTRYTTNELQQHRDNWYARVKGAPIPTYDEAAIALDKNVDSAILKLLPYKGTMRLLDQHNFAAPFRASLFSDFDRFVITSDDPAMEFIDADLEGMRATLVENMSKFAYHLASNTWPLGKDLQSVPPEWKDSQPDRLDRVVNELNEMSTKVADQ